MARRIDYVEPITMQHKNGQELAHGHSEFLI